MTDTERVEFVDAPVPAGGADDLVESGDDPRPPGRWGWIVVGLVVVAVVVAALVAGLAGGSSGDRTTTATPAPRVVGRSTPPVTTPVFGLIGLPPSIGDPRTLVAAQTGDVVWMLDRGGGVVRIENGHRTAATLLESQATAIAVDPSGTRLYVATGASRPGVQVLDAATLRLGHSVAVEGSVSALAVSTDAVWAASGSRLLRLDLDTLATLDTLTMPGVVLTGHLRVQLESDPGGQTYVVGLVTGGNDDGTTTSRFVRVDPRSREVRFGAPIPDVTDVATSHFLTWTTTSDTPPATEGYASVLDRSPRASTIAPLPAGSHIYDGGGGYAAFLSVAPHSSVVTCHDDGGFATSEIDVAPAVPDAVVTGQVLRTDTAFYVITDRGLVRSGVGACT